MSSVGRIEAVKEPMFSKSCYLNRNCFSLLDHKQSLLVTRGCAYPCTAVTGGEIGGLSRLVPYMLLAWGKLSCGFK